MTKGVLLEAPTHALLQDPVSNQMPTDCRSGDPIYQPCRLARMCDGALQWKTAQERPDAHLVFQLTANDEGLVFVVVGTDHDAVPDGLLAHFGMNSGRKPLCGKGVSLLQGQLVV